MIPYLLFCKDFSHEHLNNNEANRTITSWDIKINKFHGGHLGFSYFPAWNIKLTLIWHLLCNPRLLLFINYKKWPLDLAKMSNWSKIFLWQPSWFFPFLGGNHYTAILVPGIFVISILNNPCMPIFMLSSQSAQLTQNLLHIYPTIKRALSHKSHYPGLCTNWPGIVWMGFVSEISWPEIKSTAANDKRVSIFKDKHNPNRSVCDALRICYFNITIYCYRNGSAHVISFKYGSLKHWLLKFH